MSNFTYVCRAKTCEKVFTSPVNRSRHEFKQHSSSEVDKSADGKRRNYFQSSENHDKQCVYVLELSDDNYYVGISQTPKKRINQHRKGDGANWTNKHGVVSVVEITEPMLHEEALEEERKKTKEMIEEHGKGSVRGSYWLNDDRVSEVEV